MNKPGNKGLFRLLSVLVLASLVFSACKPKTEATESPTPPLEPTPTNSGIQAVDDGSALAPEIIAQDPPPGMQLPLDGKITLTFSLPMDPDPTSSAIQMKGPDGEPVAGTIDWLSTSQLEFTPASELSPGSRYTINVSEGAASLEGVKISEPASFEYSTSGELAVSQVFPADDTKDVSTSAVITVIFNRPVVPLVAAEDQGDLPQPIRISPSTPGKGEWVNTSIYAFQSEKALVGDMDYTVTVEAGLEDAVQETELVEDYSWSFHTAAPGIDSLELGSGVVNPEDGYQNLLLDEYFRLNFLQPMDAASTEASLVLLQDQGESADLIKQWNSDLTQLVITPTEQLALGASYTLNLDKTALAADGGMLKAGLAWKFSTVPAPAIISISPPNNTTQENYSTELRVQFASPMQIDSVKERIIIRPEPEKDVEWWYQEWDFSFASYFLQPSTRYEVQFLAGMEDIYGNAIQTGRTVRFTTAAQPPTAYLQMPYEPILMRPDGPQDFYAFYRNIDGVSLQMNEITAEQMVSFMTGEKSSFEYQPADSTLIWKTGEVNTARLNETVLKAFTPATEGGDPLPSGFYFLGMDAEGIQKYNPWVDTRLVIIANSNLTFKTSAVETLIWLTDLASGQPVPRAGIGVYDKAMNLVGEGITDPDGLLKLELPSLEQPYDTRFAVSTSGDIFAFASSQGDSGVEMWQYGNYGGYFAPANQPTAYVYTERPIYRPGQPVYFKGIVRNDDDLDYSIPDTQEIRVKISSFEEVVFESDLILSDMGTFDGEFLLDTEAALGYYTMEIFYPDREQSIGSVGFTVAEYKRPEFMVAVTAAPTNVLAGEEFIATIQADYYSGGAVSDASTAWTLTSERFNFSPPEEYSSYSFSDSDIDEGETGEEDQGSQVIAQGEGKTDADGRFSTTLAADLSGSKTSLIFTFEGTVTDLSNNAVSGRAQVIGHRSQVYPGAKPQSHIGLAGEEEFFQFLSLDWNGEILSGQSLDIEIVERRWHSVQEQDASGRIQWKSTVEEIPVENFSGILTDENGQASVGFTPPNGGIFRARVSALDTEGNISTASAYMWVAGDEYIPWQQTNDRSFELVADRKDYSPGETAEILIASPFQGESYALVTVERGRVHFEDVVRITSNSTIYQLPITASMAPNAFVSVLVVKGIDETNPRPNFKMGIVEIGVDRSQQEVRVILEANPEQATPGDTITYNLQTLDFQGNPISAEVSLGLSDLATLSLLPPNSAPIMDHFYSKRTLGVWTVVPIDASIEEYNALITDEIVQGGQGGGGGGGKGAADLGVMEVRQDFPDTAFWAAYIQTNEEGQATVNIILPDNLTTWRMDARAVNEVTQVGQGTLDLVSSKSLLVRPQTPRFFVAGDRATIGATVQNNTEESLQVEVGLEAQGVHTDDPASQSVMVAAGSQVYVSWTVEVEGSTDRVDLVISAQGGGLEDASRPPQGTLDNQGIPVYRFSAPEQVGTSGQILEEGTLVEAINLPSNIDDSQGELTVKINPSLAAGIYDGLAYLESYPYECIEQTISRFLPAVMVTLAMQEAGISDPAMEKNLEDLVETSLQRLYNWQNPDGGWGWWQNETSDPLTSAYVVFGLLEAETAGYGVSENVISDGLKYLTRQLKPVLGLTSPQLLNRQAFILYVLARAERPAISSTSQLYEQRQNLATYAIAFLAQTLAWIDDQDPRIATLLSDLNTSAIVSASGTHWQEEEVDRWNWNTDTRSTAIVLSVLSILDTENPVVANAARWLTNHRRDDHWQGTQETSWTLMALTNWMAASGELEADYLYGVTLNGEDLGGGAANATNLKETAVFTVPIVQLLKDEINRLAIARDDGQGNLYYTAHLNAYLPVADITSLDQGITISRSYYSLDDLENPIVQAKQGDLILGRLTIVVPQDVHYLLVNDPLPAGLEIVDQSLSTSPQSLEIPQEYTQDDIFWRGWGWWYFTHVQFRDERVQLSSSFLPAGTYIYTYLVRASTVGEFNTIPPTAQEFYFPEVYGRGTGSIFTIAQ